MSIPGSASPLFIGAGAADAAAFQIDRSVRLNKEDSAYFSKTFSSASNRKTWTWSGWVKRANSDSDHHLFVGDKASSESLSNSTFGRFYITSGGNLSFGGYSTGYRLTSALLRDPAAWYHLVAALDTTQSTADDRVKIYINGVQVTTFDTKNNPSQNDDLGWNTATPHTIGARSRSGTIAHYHDGYLAEIHFIDGQALAPSDFGKYDDNNVWQPKAYSGSYGTNGFYLKFADNSSNAALGTDSSGNDNDWSVNNLSAAGSAWNQSQTWSSSLSSSTGFRSSEPATNAFDGDTSSICSAVNNGVVTFTSPVTFASDSTIRVIVHGGDHTVTVNGGSDQTISAGSYQTVSFTNSSNSTFVMTFQRDASADTGIRAIEIGGNVLVDSGVVDPNAAGIDSLIDTPTNYTPGSGNAGGNYATFNPLVVVGTDSFGGTNGNLDSSGSNRFSSSTIAVSSGKFYFETTVGAAGVTVGIWQPPFVASAPPYEQTNYRYFGSDGKIYTEAGSTVASYNTYTNGDVIGIALDMDNGKVFFSKNGTWQGSSDPAGGTNAAASGLTGMWVFGVNHGGDATHSANFGQRSFAYTPPSNYLALVTTNLSDPTIADGSTAFDVALWTGNGSSAQTISTPNLSPDMVWFKERSSTSSHAIVDAVRGATNAAKVLYPDRTDAEATANQYQSITSLNSDGFTIGSSDNSINQSSQTYVGWAWDAGTSTVSNTDGSITSSVRANPSAGFSIVTWDDGATNGTVGHGLNAAPDFIICKSRDVVVVWVTYHSALGKDKYIPLNAADAAYSVSNLWGTAEPTSSVFGVGTQNSDGNNDGQLVAYCWTAVEGYSAFGGPYSGTGSASTGAFQYCGFKPRLLMIKRTDSSTSGNWIMLDSERSPRNVVNDPLYANSNATEYADKHDIVDFLSNGFKIKAANNDGNNSGGSFIWAAWAESPFKTSRAH